MFRVSGAWSFVGVSLTLVALYLLLEHAGQASQIFTALASSLGGIYGVLQGRTASVGGR